MGIYFDSLSDVLALKAHHENKGAKQKKPKGFDSGGVAGGNGGMSGPTDFMGQMEQGMMPQNNYVATAPQSTFSSTSPTQASTLAQANSQASGGAGPASGTIAAESALSQSLSAAANGQGPNPALDQLRQTTSQNINTAAGMAASSRGVNPALAARMAVDSAAGSNQNAAGQAATMSAEQQIAARKQLGQNLSSTGALQLGQQSAGANLLGTAGGLDLTSQGLNQQTDSQNASLKLGTEELNAGIAGQNAGIRAGSVSQAEQTGSNILGGALNAAGKAISVAKGGMIGYAMGGVPGMDTFALEPDPNSAPSSDNPMGQYLDNVHGGQSPKQKTSTPDDGKDAFNMGDTSGMQANQRTQSGAQSAFAQIASRPVLGAAMANGGSIYAAGGIAARPPQSQSNSGGDSSGGTSTDYPAPLFLPDDPSRPRLVQTTRPDDDSKPKPMARGGKVPAMVSPGEKVLPPGTTPGRAAAITPVAPRIPGKAHVHGDSPKNDTVHARLQAGSIVLPRSVVNAKNPSKAASSFVASVLKRSGGKYSAGGAVSLLEQRRPAALADYSGGGMVASGGEAKARKEDSPEPAARATARGVGRDETRRRMKVSSERKHREED